MPSTLQADLLRDLFRVAGEDLDISSVISSSLIWSGPSRIDGAPLAVIAIVRSTNSKTANMVQTYIIRADIDPITAVKMGLDASICGGCIHRGDGTGFGRTCYVNLGQGPRAVFDGLARGIYDDISSDPDAIAALGFGRMVRLGTYGDPTAVPIHVWRALLTHAEGHTGYTHQWRSARIAGDYRGLLMASCDNADDREKARGMGWGTFTVIPRQSFTIGAQTFEMTPVGRLCPASKEAGNVTNCADCRKCNGSATADIYIPAHGATAGRYTGRRVLPTL
jgi:hypothetical protein